MNELRGMQLGGCELLEEIGQGGMGQIYRARQLSLDRIVAVKILSDHLAHNPSFVERFQREARAIAKVNHPNILAVYDVGHHEDRHFMIMELVEHGSLAELLDQRGLLDCEEAAAIVLQAARGLECAARHNIIHRDVKPDNIMIGEQGVAKVSDFGLAKELDSTMTETQAVMGTPAYMSPEQCDGRDLDSRTDIYSLGGTFYRCVTGRLPFEADTAMSMMYRHKHVPLVPPRQIMPAMPVVYSDLIVRMMAKERAERFQDMAEVVRALEAASSFKPEPDPNRTLVLPTAQQEAGDGGEDEDEKPAFLRHSHKPAPHPTTSVEQRADTRQRCMQAAEKLRAQGKLMQAARELRRLVEVDPSDEKAREVLQQLERRLGEKRTVAAELRNLVASAHYEGALEKWNSLDAELRDEQLAGQMAHLASAVVPALRSANRGDEEVGAGHLDSAYKLYEEALRLDPGSEKAKVGIKNVERTRQRIQVLLKDGYTHRQHRDYEQAVKVWGKILEVEPDNSQARRLIIEARLAAAGEAFSAEDFDRAVRHCDELLALDAKQEEAGRLRADAAAKRDRVAELRKSAELARNRGDLSGTAKAYRELTSVIPKSRLARDGLDSTRRALSRHRTKRLLVLLVLTLLAAAGFFFVQDFRRLGRARRAWESQDYARARTEAEAVRFPILKAEAEGIRVNAIRSQAMMDAAAAQRDGRWTEAIKALDAAIEYASEGGRKPLQLQRVRCEFEMAVGLARAAEGAGKWEEAQSEYLKAQNAARDADYIENGAMRAEKDSAERDRIFCAHFAEGLRLQAEGKLTQAKASFRMALAYRRDSDLVRKKLEELGESGL